MQIKFNIKYLAVFLIIVALVVPAKASFFGSSHSSSNSNCRKPATIFVNGNSEISTEPDVSYISLTIETNATTSKQAQLKNSEIRERLVSSLKRHGIDEEDIETTYYHISKIMDYHYNPETRKSENIFKGYKASHSIKITINDISKTGEIIDAVVSAGVNNLDSVYFGLSEKKRQSTYLDALEKASKQAKEKAKRLAKSLGVDLGDIYSVSESGSYYPVYSNSYIDSAVAKSYSSQTDVFPGDIKVKAYVSVSYEIE